MENRKSPCQEMVLHQKLQNDFRQRAFSLPVEKNDISQLFHRKVVFCTQITHMIVKVTESAG